MGTLRKVGNVVLPFIFIALLMPSVTACIPIVGHWLAKWSISVSVLPLAAIGWLNHPSKWSVLPMILGWALLIFAMLQLPMLRPSVEQPTPYQLALLGSILGYMTYLPISIIGKYHEIEDDHHMLLDKINSGLLSQLDSSVKKLSAPDSSSTDSSPAFKELQQLNQQIAANRLAYHREPSWDEVLAAIEWPVRIMRLPMVMGIAGGLVFLGSMMHISDFDKEPPIGVFFLVGLYPRLFEAAFKGLADRLTKEKD